MTAKPLPATADEAFAHVNSVTDPTLDDLRLMVMLEAWGIAYYEDLAAQAPDDEIRALLAANAREELGHAERVAAVAKRLHGVDIAIPSRAENPFAPKPGEIRLTREALAGTVAGELHGEQLYELWASKLGDAEAARLLRLNGREERTHSERADQALARMPA
jgi:rubrerythrin